MCFKVSVVPDGMELNCVPSAMMVGMRYKVPLVFRGRYFLNSALKKENPFCASNVLCNLKW